MNVSSRSLKRLVSYDRKIAIFHKCLILGWVFGVKLSDEDIADFEVVRVIAMATGFSFPYMGVHICATWQIRLCGGDAALCEITLTTC